jgi:parvulin-like peptidyl-prolyl isomerase
VWQPVDRIVIVVNEDMLTSQQLQHDLEVWKRQRAISKEEESRAINEFESMRVRYMLEVQAGQDMGIDPAIVKAQVNDYIQELIRERFNGVAGLADFLQSKDLDSGALRDQYRDKIYAEIWEKFVTGEAALPGSRVSRDRYVRPGFMLDYFKNGMQHPEGVEQMGGKQQEVVLQYLFIDERAEGGEIQAKNLLTMLRKRIQDGEDMGDICERYSASPATRRERGMMPPAPESHFASLDPAIGAFLANAKPGEISEILPFTTKEGAHYWRIAKLVDRTSPVLPNLSTLEVQQKVIQRIQEDYDEFRKRSALAQMYLGSYVWPPELTQH